MRRKSFVVRSLMFAIASAAATSLSAAPYQDVVFSLAPTYYYELNETDTSSGVRDSMGNAPNGTYNGDYVGAGGPRVGVPGPQFINNTIPVPGVGGELNFAHASNNTGHINLGPSDAYGDSAMTVALFAKAGPAAGGDRLFTNNLTDPLRSFQVNVGNDGLVIGIDPNASGVNAERTLYLPDNTGVDRGLTNTANGWYHIIASTEGSTAAQRAANIRVWINGVNRTSNMQIANTGWGVDTNIAKIGGRRVNPTDSTTHSGAQDEVAIWLGRVLSDEEAESLWLGATAPPGPDCNLDGVAGCGVFDLDLLMANLGTDITTYDLDESGEVTLVDRDLWLDIAGDKNIGRAYLLGDANLDGAIDESDATAVLGGLYRNTSAWSAGEFSGDGKVDGTDFNIWNSNRGALAAGATVPEPGSALLSLVGLMALLLGRRR